MILLDPSERLDGESLVILRVRLPPTPLQKRNVSHGMNISPAPVVISVAQPAVWRVQEVMQQEPLQAA